MLKTLALALALTFSATACMTTDEPDLVFEDGGDGKADVIRPYGIFNRTLPDGEQGFTFLKLREDRTYEASENHDAVTGNYRFASSRGNTYVVLYDKGAIAYSFEYKLDGDKLELRETGGDTWFSLARPADLSLTETDDAGTFDVIEGGDVVLALPANPSTGYGWTVTMTDRTFGYPTETFAAEDGPVGGGGTSTLTWKTDGALSVVGQHSVTLEYRRASDTTSPPDRTFSFTVDVKSAR